MMDRENAQFSFGNYYGAILAKPGEELIIHLIIRNSVFNHIYA